MKIIYRPESGGEQTWDVNLGRIPRKRAAVLQKIYGSTWARFYAAIMQGDIEAQAVILWHAMSADHPSLRFDDLPDFLPDELEIRFTQPEYERLRANIAESDDIAPDQRAQALAWVDARIEALNLADVEAGEGKAAS